MKEIAVVWLFADLVLIVFGASFCAMLVWPPDAFGGHVAAFIVAVAFVGLVIVNVLTFTDEAVRGQLAARAELCRLRKKQREERLAAIDATRAAIIVNLAALRAEQAATSALEREFATFTAAQVDLLDTFNSATIELGKLRLSPAEAAERRQTLASTFQRAANQVTHVFVPYSGSLENE